MNEVYDDPVLGPLKLKKSGKGESGYENVNKRPNGLFYAKARLNLNFKEQTTLSGQGIGFVTARECAIHLALYLKEHPPIPKDSGSKKVLPIPSNPRTTPLASLPCLSLTRCWSCSRVLAAQEGGGGGADGRGDGAHPADVGHRPRDLQLVGARRRRGRAARGRQAHRGDEGAAMSIHIPSAR